MRFRDRFFDLHIHLHMQKIVGDRLRPAGAKDPHGVEDARTRMAAALGIVEKEMASRDVIKQPWAAGESFTLADCAAAPALFYADKVAPFAGIYPNLVAYLDRLKQRPSYARTLKEAEPYFKFFPKDEVRLERQVENQLIIKRLARFFGRVVDLHPVRSSSFRRDALKATGWLT